MDQNISDLQKRRADNIIWNCAGDYTFTPDFKAYDVNGDPDIYRNILFGAARRHYEYEKLEKLFAMLDKYRHASFYQALFWDALEPLLFRAEAAARPVLVRMRREPAETELKFNEGMTTDEIVETARRFFDERYGLRGDGRMRAGFRLPHGRRMSVDSFLQRGLTLFHEKVPYEGDPAGWNGDFSLGTKMSEPELRAFLETKFGKAIYPAGYIAQLEKKLCTGNHKFTHLFYTRGEVCELEGIYSTFEMHQRRRREELIANNRIYYEKNLLQHRQLISKLSINIMNSMLLHMQPERLRACSGLVDPARAWRASAVGDGKIFARKENENAGDMSVDILLDASHSQISRAEKIASQAYIIAEALARCRVPCRVMSFCSMSGFTVMRLFNDYSSSEGSDGIFDYYAEGCNRDGLAVRAAGELMSHSPYEHKMLIILSDVKPLDVAKIRKDERDVGKSYDRHRALADTAHEVRRLRAEGAAVLCIFTGNDEDLPSARMVYGNDFVRIRDFSCFADTVGKLIIDQIKSYSM